jgi:anion-transporting  ArsA/GET3 family ATPase
MPASLTDSRLAIVSGKGGVGKTTVAAALATAAAKTGKKVLLVEVEQREGLAPLFGQRPIGYAERELAPNITGLSIEPDEALVEYIYLFYGIRRVGKVLRGTKAIEFATNVAPGLRDILLIGKVKEAERRRQQGRYVYDLIVLDAPPTGRLPRFLDAPRAVTELVNSGPIKQQAQGVLDMTTDPKRCKVVLVTLPEDMPVRETVEAADKLAKMNVSVGPIIVNEVLPELFPAGKLRSLAKDATEPLAADAAAAGIRLAEEAIAGLARVTTLHARKTVNQREAIAELERETSIPSMQLPYLFSPRMGTEQLEQLAGSLAEQGALA